VEFSKISIVIIFSRDRLFLIFCCLGQQKKYHDELRFQPLVSSTTECVKNWFEVISESSSKKCHSKCVDTQQPLKNAFI